MKNNLRFNAMPNNMRLNTMLDDLLNVKAGDSGQKTWVGLAELMKAVECGSIASAAESMEITEDTFQENITILEESICTQILLPSEGELRLTDMGKRFVRRCSGVLEEVEDIVEETINRRWFTTRNPAGVLRMGVPHLLGERYIIPAVVEFMRKYPELDIELNFHSGKVDLAGRGYDIAIEVGIEIKENHISHTLASNRFHVCGSPSYFEKYGSPTTPDEIKEHKTLLFSQNGQVRPWYFNKDGKQINMRLTPKWYSNNADALLVAARYGVGLAYLPSYCVADDLNKGSLVSTLDDWSQQEEKIQLIHLYKQNSPAKITQFVEFISDRFKHFPEMEKTNIHLV